MSENCGTVATATTAIVGYCPDCGAPMRAPVIWIGVVRPLPTCCHYEGCTVLR